MNPVVTTANDGTKTYHGIEGLKSILRELYLPEGKVGSQPDGLSFDIYESIMRQGNRPGSRLKVRFVENGMTGANPQTTKNR